MPQRLKVLGLQGLATAPSLLPSFLMWPMPAPQAAHRERPSASGLMCAKAGCTPQEGQPHSMYGDAQSFPPLKLQPWALRPCTLPCHPGAPESCSYDGGLVAPSSQLWPHCSQALMCVSSSCAPTHVSKPGQQLGPFPLPSVLSVSCTEDAQQ